MRIRNKKNIFISLILSCFAFVSVLEGFVELENSNGPLEVYKSDDGVTKIVNKYTEQSIEGLSNQEIEQIENGKMSQSAQQALMLEKAGNKQNQDLALVHVDSQGKVIDALTGQEILNATKSSNMNIADQRALILNNPNTPKILEELISVVPGPDVILNQEQRTAIQNVINKAEKVEVDNAFDETFPDIETRQLLVDKTLDQILGEDVPVEGEDQSYIDILKRGGYAEAFRLDDQLSGSELKVRTQEEAELTRQQDGLEADEQDLDAVARLQEMQKDPTMLDKINAKLSQVKETLSNIADVIGNKIKQIGDWFSSFITKTENVARFDRAITAEVTMGNAVSADVFSSIQESASVDPEKLQDSLDYFNKEINRVTNNVQSEKVKAGIKRERAVTLQEARVFVQEVKAAQALADIASESIGYQAQFKNLVDRNLTSDDYLQAIGSDPFDLGKMVTGASGDEPASLKSVARFTGDQTSFYEYLKDTNRDQYNAVQKSIYNQLPLANEQVRALGEIYKDYVKNEVFAPDKGTTSGSVTQVAFKNLPPDVQIPWLEYRADIGDVIADRLVPIARSEGAQSVIEMFADGKKLFSVSDAGKDNLAKLQSQAEKVQNIIDNIETLITDESLPKPQDNTKKVSVASVDAFAQTLKAPNVGEMSYWQQQLNEVKTDYQKQQARERLNALTNELAKFEKKVQAIESVKKLSQVNDVEQQQIEALGSKKISGDSFVSDLGSNSAFNLGKMLTGSDGTTPAQSSNAVEFFRPVSGEGQGFYQWLNTVGKLDERTTILLGDAVSTSIKNGTPLTQQQVTDVGRSFQEFAKKRIADGKKQLAELPSDLQTVYLRMVADGDLDSVASILASIAAEPETHQFMEVAFNGDRIDSLSHDTDMKLSSLQDLINRQLDARTDHASTPKPTLNDLVNK